MSGSLSTYTGGGSRYLTNPKHLPIISLVKSGLAIKEGITTQTLSSVAGFFTALARDGASSAITVADTYVTVTNQTGPGFLFDLVLPTHSAAHRSTARVTIDGTVYTITQSADQTATWRTVIGALTVGASVTSITTASVSGDIPLPNASFDAGFKNAKIGGVRQYGSSGADVLVVPSESAIMTYGMPMLRFESSLLIEMKCNLLSADAVEKQCGATFRMDL